MGLNDLRSCHIGKQALELFFRHVVALACLRLQSLSIQHGNVAATVVNQPGVLQFSGGFRNALTAAYIFSLQPRFTFRN